MAPPEPPPQGQLGRPSRLLQSRRDPDRLAALWLIACPALPQLQRSVRVRRLLVPLPAAHQLRQPASILRQQLSRCHRHWDSPAPPLVLHRPTSALATPAGLMEPGAQLRWPPAAGAAAVVAAGQLAWASAAAVHLPPAVLLVPCRLRRAPAAPEGRLAEKRPCSWSPAAPPLLPAAIPAARRCLLQPRFPGRGRLSLQPWPS